MNFQTLFLQIIACGYILAQKLKQLFYHTKIEVVILHKLYPAKTSTIIVENTENSTYSSSYTIEYKIVRNSHLLSHKIGIFSSTTAIVPTNKHKLLTRKIIKAAIDCSYAYCEGKYNKCYKYAPFSSNALLFSLVLKSQLTLLLKIQNK